MSVAATAAVLALLLPACGGDGQPGGSGPAASASLDPEADLRKQRLTVSNWDGYMPKDLPDRFESAVGTPMTVAKHATNEEIVAKLTAGGDSGIDVAFVSGQYAQALTRQGLLEPIHHDLVPTWRTSTPRPPELAYDKGNVYSVPVHLGHHRHLLPQGPRRRRRRQLERPARAATPRYDGKVTMMTTERWLVLPAQKALGYSVNTTDEDEMPRSRSCCSRPSTHLLAYDDTTFYERLISGEAVMVEAWDGWCTTAPPRTPTSSSSCPRRAATSGSTRWSSSSRSENKEAAHAFINYDPRRPKIHAWVAENILYNVPNEAAMAELARPS